MNQGIDCAKELKVQEDAIRILSAESAVLDSAIQEHLRIEDNLRMMVNEYDGKANIYKLGVEARDYTISQLNKSLRKHKFKKWVWGAAAAGIVYGLFQSKILK